MSEEIKSAKEKADEYAQAKTGSAPPAAAQQEDKKTQQTEPRGLEEWESLANQRIEDAMRAGAFDNLPGKGKPLRSDAEAFEPSDQRMANKLLKNNDLAPGWIGDRNALQREIEALRSEITATAERYQTLLDEASSPQLQQEVRNGWGLYVARWDEAVTELNRKILTLNLQLPTIRLELFQLRLDEELTKAGAGRNLRNRRD
jgi:DnaJ family protein C protein 28